VPEVGVEPTHPCGYGILSPARLPFRHSGIPRRQHQQRERSLANDKSHNAARLQSARSTTLVFVSDSGWAGESQRGGVLSRASAIPPLRHSRSTTTPAEFSKGPCCVLLESGVPPRSTIHESRTTASACPSGAAALGPGSPPLAAGRDSSAHDRAGTALGGAPRCPYEDASATPHRGPPARCPCAPEETPHRPRWADRRPPTRFSCWLAQCRGSSRV
jgi:hypothetical protein